MVQAAEMGAIIFPPVPAFYARPSSMDEMVDNTVGRILTRLGIDNALFKQWKGVGR
jgi:4-hydroxy-3-polyprenylbenzoate decarboxylase